MNKCTKCGTEFEGNFCPECGQRAEGQACPKCGALRENGAKFCKECGYSFSGASAAQTPPQKAVRQPRQISKKTESAFKNAHNILNILPAWISAVFTILVFVAMALPAVVTPSYEIMGEKIPSENLGSLFGAYAGNIEDVPLKGCAVAALLFAVLSVVLTGVLIAFCRVKQLNNSAVTAIKIYRVRVKTIVEMLCGAIYIAYIAISAAAMGIISATDEGMGLITSGVGVILLLVLACVAFIFTLVCAASDRFIILKNFPQFDEIPERKPIEFCLDRPNTVEKPQTPLWQEKRLQRYAILKRICYLGAVPQIIIWICFFVSFIIMLFGESLLFTTIGILYYTVILIFIFTTILSCTCLKPKILNIKLKKAIIIILIITAISVSVISVRSLLLSLVSPIILVAGLTDIILCIATLVYGKKTKNLLYIDKKQGILTDYGKDFVQRQNEYKVAATQYNAYKKDLCRYNLAKAMCKDGYNYRDEWDRRIYRVHTHKVLTAVVVLLLSVLIILAVVLPVTPVSATLFKPSEPHDLDGTYYVYRNEKYEEDNYIIITGNHWEDDDGVNGKLTRDGDNLSFKSIVFGVEDEVYSGVRVGEGVLMLKIFGADIYFCMDGKTPPNVSVSAFYNPRLICAINCQVVT